MTDPQSTPAGSLTVVGLAAVVLLGIHLATAWMNADRIRDRGLLDTDAYSWMNRVTHMAETGEWFEHTLPRINPPEGHVQHWTRPMDGLLLAGGAALSPIVGFDEGLYFWALGLTPLLHLLTLGFLAWAVLPLLRRSLLPPEGLGILMLVFLTQLAVYQAFLVGRPDHHALLALLFVVYLGFWMRVLLDEGGRWGPAVGLGLVGAGGIWVNVEALLFVAFGMAGLGLSWLLGNLRLARDAAVHGVALLFGVVVALFVEWGPAALGIREVDTLSIAHVGLMTLVAAFWLSLWGVSRTQVGDSVRGRAAFGFVAVSAVLTALYLMLPEFFANPLDEVDQLYAETRLQFIKELQPLGDIGHGAAGTFGAVVFFVGPALVAVPFAVVRALRSRSRADFAIWVVFALMVGLYAVMAINERRWADYAALSALVPFTLMATRLLEPLSGPTAPGWFKGLRLIAHAFLVLAHLVVGGTLLAYGAAGDRAMDREGSLNEWWGDPDSPPLFEVRPRAVDHVDENGCDLVLISEVLRDDGWFRSPKLLLAHTDHGPELMFRTHHSVLSIPNHRFQPGYTFMHQVMGHGDPSESARLLRNRGVDIVVLCRSDLPLGLFRYPNPDAFAHWLAEGGIPEGFLLHAATDGWRVYRSRR